MIVLASLWVPVFCCFVWRAYHLQITRHKELKEKARIKYLTKVKIIGKRGEIFDVDGNLLVANMPRISIAFSPHAAIHDAFDKYDKSSKEEVRAKAPALREQRRRKLALIFSQVFHKPFMEYYRALEPFHTVIAKDGTVKQKRNQYVLLEREAEKKTADLLKAKLAEAKLELAFNTQTVHLING